MSKIDLELECGEVEINPGNYREIHVTLKNIEIEHLNNETVYNKIDLHELIQCVGIPKIMQTIINLNIDTSQVLDELYDEDILEYAKNI